MNYQREKNTNLVSTFRILEVILPCHELGLERLVLNDREDLYGDEALNSRLHWLSRTDSSWRTRPRAKPRELGPRR